MPGLGETLPHRTQQQRQKHRLKRWRGMEMLRQAFRLVPRAAQNAFRQVREKVSERSRCNPAPHRNRQDPLQEQCRPWKQVERIKRNHQPGFRSRLKTAVCRWDRRQQRFRERHSLPGPGNSL